MIEVAKLRFIPITRLDEVVYNPEQNVTVYHSGKLRFVVNGNDTKRYLSFLTSGARYVRLDGTVGHDK